MDEQDRDDFLEVCNVADRFAAFDEAFAPLLAAANAAYHASPSKNHRHLIEITLEAKRDALWKSIFGTPHRCGWNDDRCLSPFPPGPL